MANYGTWIGWSLVTLAVAAEMVGIFGLSLYTRKKNLINRLLYFGGLAASFVALYYSFHYLPVSIAYTVLTGIGTAAAVVINIMFFNESKDIKRIISLAFIIAGVCGLKFLS
ncbi:DMT family transporter [Wohlfahrtiimonas chitiniclastica]|uniref:DMT family transporter n=1 Tax=Wohlfahrtiimonas chitiniclastica TaxID=400946 RepID=UPI001BCAB798|nr:SMR family transporter [Wohlfahrtiimonas chitiniclastica]MBS7836168.1 QacE family quaternary ammonium compound efflux SMR transporter [Wohlfahrtiimonas chitiniclastica]